MALTACPPSSFASTRYARPSAPAEASRPPTLLERISRTPTPSAPRRRSASPPSTTSTLPPRRRAVDRDLPHPPYPPFHSADASPPTRPLLIDPTAALPYSAEPDGSETPPLPSASAPARLGKVPAATTAATAVAPPQDSDEEMEEGELQEEGEIEEPAKPASLIEEEKPTLAQSERIRSATPPRPLSPPPDIGRAASPRRDTPPRPVAVVRSSEPAPRNNAAGTTEATRAASTTIEQPSAGAADMASDSRAPSSSPVLGRTVDSIASAPPSTETSARLSSDSPRPAPAAAESTEDVAKAAADSPRRQVSPAGMPEPVTVRSQGSKSRIKSQPVLIYTLRPQRSPTEDKAGTEPALATSGAADTVVAREQQLAANARSEKAQSSAVVDSRPALASESGPVIEEEQGGATSTLAPAVKTMAETPLCERSPTPIEQTVSAAAAPPFEGIANVEVRRDPIDVASAADLEMRDGEAHNSPTAEERQIKEEDTPMADANESAEKAQSPDETRLNEPEETMADDGPESGRPDRSASPKPALASHEGARSASPAREPSNSPVEPTMEERRIKLVGERKIEPFGERLDLLNIAWSAFEDWHSRLSASLTDTFVERDERRKTHFIALRREYKTLQGDWKAHCKRLDDLKERQHRRANGGNTQNATAPQTPSIDSAGMPFYPEPVTPGPSLTGGRSNRRGTGASVGVLGFSDTVRSEAEFLEILASLETADLRDPDVRAARTAAVVPDMAVDESERREVLELALDDERYRVSDPVSEFAIDAPLDVWTEHEVEIFCKRYALHPKQFGKISQELPDKSTAQCVLFYYRMKNTIDFRSLSDRRGRDGRRKKSKKRPEGGKGSSLLSNLNKKARPALAPPREDEPDEDDEEEPSAPASPRAERRLGPNADHAHSGEDVRQSGASGAADQPVAHSRAPAPRRIRLVSKTPIAGPVDLPSEGMMEAAEVLGALAALPGAQPDEVSAGDDQMLLEGREGEAHSRSGAGRARRARVDADTLPTEQALAASPYAVAPDTDVLTPSADATKSRRRNNTSSYWTLAERAEYQRLLTEYGPDWRKIAAGLGNKTWVQCRNVSRSPRFA